MLASMSPVPTSRGLRGRLRWAEPACASSASDLETEDSVLSLAISTDTAPSLSFSSRRQSPSRHRVRSCEARRRDGLMADLQSRCQNLEGETLVLQRELKRMQELQCSGHKLAHVPLPPSSALVPPASISSGRSGASPKRRSCSCGLEAEILELQAELGAMAIDAQHERERQASQIAKLESELRGGKVSDSDLVDEATAEFERWLSSQNATTVGRASSSQDQGISDQKTRSRDVPEQHSCGLQGRFSGGQASSGSCSRPPPQRSSGYSTPTSAAGPLPPPSYRGSDFCSIASDFYQQQPTGNHLGVNRSSAFNRFSGASRLDSAEEVVSFNQGVPQQILSGSDPFSPCFGATLGPALAVRVGEMPQTTQIVRTQPDHHQGVEKRDVSLQDLQLSELPLLPSVPPPARPPGLPMERPPPPPFMSQHSTPRTQSSWQAAMAESHFEFKLTEANLREAMGALQAGSHPTSTRCTSVSLANFRDSTGVLEQDVTGCHTGRTIVEEIGRGMRASRDGGDVKLVGNSRCSGTGLDEEVAMRLYQRFGLGTCMTFDKFVQMHEAHLPREKPLVRPATGGA